MEQTTTTKQSWVGDLETLVNKASTALGNLRVQLALGEAEATDKFREQKNNVSEHLLTVERYIDRIVQEKAVPIDTQPDLDRARIKLDILRLHFHYSEMNVLVQQEKLNELKKRINLVPENLELHEHLLAIEEEIKSSSHSKTN